MYLRTIQQVEKGKSYDIDVRNHNKNTEILAQCRAEFKQPYLIQYIAKIEPSSFDQSRLAENFNRGFKRTIKQNKKFWKTPPDYQAFYSLEYKGSDARAIEGDYSIRTNLLSKKPLIDYHHIHLYLCFDCHTPYRPMDMNNLVIETLDNITGMSYAHYAKRYKSELYYHNLNKEYEDAIARIQYISKIEQKDGVPYKKKSGSFKSIQPKYS
ncbi:hypothetical protein [Acinetobacter indicus]|uniref:hypothetical protein n=1 Tax=Acinetobacter indicus TaxID=756892 RepID=UPI002577D683|nr:hypothetical protein [Acinetobacter indicus]MDM1245578.1 hypothetical protein [Acinetobacter indicus]MDM1289632.1 hypothetical protein [Acinetobacter indicus]